MATTAKRRIVSYKIVAHWM